MSDTVFCQKKPSTSLSMSMIRNVGTPYKTKFLKAVQRSYFFNIAIALTANESPLSLLKAYFEPGLMPGIMTDA